MDIELCYIDRHMLITLRIILIILRIILIDNFFKVK